MTGTVAEKLSMGNELINKIDYIHLYDGISFSHKKNEVLVHAITWVNLENIMLNKRGQSQKATYCDTIMWKVQNKQIHGVENQLFVKGQEEGEGKSDYYWVWGFILWDNENILELDNVDSHATLWI